MWAWIYEQAGEFFNAEALMQWSERKNETDSTAVGIRDEEAAGLFACGLRLDDVEVIDIDFRHNEWNIGRHAEGRAVGNNRAAGRGEFGFKLASDGCVD